jgi:predicted metallopeptidase
MRIKWCKEKAKQIYHELCLANGDKPVGQHLINTKEFSFLPSKIIEYWGEKRNLDIELGYEPLKSIWTKDKVKLVYHKICLANGDKPVSQKLYGKFKGLKNAVKKFYEAKYDLDVELGYVPMRVNWDLDKVKKTYHELCLTNGNKPISANNIRKAKLGYDIVKQICKYWGTKEILDRELGYKPFRIKRTKETIIEEYKLLCLKNDNKPISHEELFKLNTGLGSAINKKFGSKMELDLLLGYKPVKNYGWNRDTVKSAYHKLCLENDDKPIPSNELIIMGHNDLTTAISRHFKKTDLDKELGYDTITHWNKELVKETYVSLCEKYGSRSISQDELHKLGYGGLSSAIHTHYGGKMKLDGELGYVGKLFKVSNGSLVRSHYEALLSNFLIAQSIDYDYDGLIDENKNFRYDFRVTDMHGFEVFIELWGFSGTSKNERAKNYEKIRTKKEKMYFKLNKKVIGLDGKLFKERNYDELQNDLVTFLIEHNLKIDGFKKLSIDEFLNYECKNKWTKESVKETYHKLCLGNGNNLIKTSFLSENYGSLRKAITKFWGEKRKLDEELGYKPTTTKWSKELIFERYNQLATKLNKDFINSDEIRKHGRGLDSIIYKTFDSREDFHIQRKLYLK